MTSPTNCKKRKTRIISGSNVYYTTCKKEENESSFVKLKKIGQCTCIIRSIFNILRCESVVNKEFSIH